jgi:hypothetical protein
MEMRWIHVTEALALVKNRDFTNNTVWFHVAKYDSMISRV